MLGQSSILGNILYHNHSFKNEIVSDADWKFSQSCSISAAEYQLSPDNQTDYQSGLPHAKVNKLGRSKQRFLT